MRPWIPPASADISALSSTFQDQNSVAENALGDLFARYPTNEYHPGVLLKVVAPNQLYSTWILAVADVAEHIHTNAQKIDAAIQAEDPAIVDFIARVRISRTGKERVYYSFATKYCAWHAPSAYPIWDSRVDLYFRALRRVAALEFVPRRGELWQRYPEFKKMMMHYREHFGLVQFSFKQIDEYIWSFADPDAPGVDAHSAVQP
jgi:hypothetical protein